MSREKGVWNTGSAGGLIGGSMIKTKDRKENEIEVKGKKLLFFEKVENGENSKFITTEEAADYLGLSEGSLRIKTYRRQIPFYKIGAKVYFTKELLEKWRAALLIQPCLSHLP